MTNEEIKIRPEKCKECGFYEEDHANDDGDWVEGWGCCCPVKCHREK